MPANLIVIYGAPLSGKSTLAWQLGRSLVEKTAIISTDQLLGGSIAVPAADVEAELAMVHVELRLLVANYLKNRYHVIVEGPFLYERDGRLHDYEADIDQLVALMRNLAQRALVVRLHASSDVLAERARALHREPELAGAVRVDAAYKARYGVRFYSFDTGSTPLDEIVREITDALATAAASQ